MADCSQRRLIVEQWTTVALVAGLLALASSCALFTRQYDYRYVLASAIPKDGIKSEIGTYEANDNGLVSFQLEGLRVDVRPLSDKELNQREPSASSQGEYSTNPYTYGDWIDPDLGYTPLRFVVFEITVHNQVYAKVDLDPSEAILKTDKGEFVHAYGVSSRSSPYGNNFERYYRSRRGQSGNEYYRFDYRMGVVRSTYYGRDEPVFKGESYSGLIAFDVPRPDAEKIRLVLRDFATKFDSFGRILESIDIPFDFNRRIAVVEKIQAGNQIEVATTEVIADGPRRLSGNVPGDNSRGAGAVNAMVRSDLLAVNGCFGPHFDAGEAVAGEVVIEFAIAPSGLVGRTEVVEANVANDEVGPCVAKRVATWRFRVAGESLVALVPTAGEANPGSGIDEVGGSRSSRQNAAAAAVAQAFRQQAATQEVTVIYPFLFRAVD